MNFVFLRASNEIKMYKSHTYDTYIGFAEVGIEIKFNENLLIKYTSPMLVNQPGNIMVSDYTSQEEIQNFVQDRENKIIADYNKDQDKKIELEKKTRYGIISLVAIVIIISIIYAIQMAGIYSMFQF